MDQMNSDTQHSVSAETTREWVARARALKPVLEGAAAEMEETRAVPPEVLDALHDAQIFRTVFPRSVGGTELNPATHVQMVSAIAEGDASVAWCMAQCACAGMASGYVAPHVGREIFGDPRAVFTFGYTTGKPPCLAIPVDGGWRITGTWNFASGNRISTWPGGHCRLCDESGTPLKHPDGRFVERTMLFPRSAATVDEEWWDVMGLCATGSDVYSVDELFVPSDYTVLARVTARDHNLPKGVEAEPEPERHETGNLYRHSMQLIASTGLSSVALGAARAILDAFIPLAREKTPSHAIALRDDPHIQARIAQADARISSAQAWLVELLNEAWDECATLGGIGFPLRIKIRQACTHQVDAAREAATMLFLEAGATAIFRSNQFERRMRDVLTVAIQPQGSSARMRTAGQYYLGLPPEHLILVP